ncbi:DUF6414 family protein [Streptomyces californicus]|uniref:DUF6414 family protein n=1 Tax=Streptomyces californicus TaxID=67351 RepID=UPI0012FF1661|nr:hypothetical protein [Streptomyces californicus]QRV59533.1 hypothetical protein I6J40_35400 [Streptomyces californicus]
MMQQRNQLREFVYLDEVSVTSLVSSRKGAVPAEITDKLTDTVRTSASSNTEASSKVLKSSVGSVLESTRTQDRQVLRKATIQATFKDLYEEEWDAMAMRAANSDSNTPLASEIRSMLARPEASAREMPRWIVGQEQLIRGNLVEVEVELQADSVFQVSAFVSSFLDMFSGNSELTGQIDRQEAEGVREFNGILEKLMVGLVPIKCRLIDYEAVEVSGKEYLVRRELLEALPLGQRPQGIATYLVGVTEQDLFWKDIRRILFSKAQVRILCRLNQVGVRSSWTAVKLADMIGSIVPGFGQQFDSFVTDVLRAMTIESNVQAPQDAARTETLVIFGNLLAQEGDITLTDADRSELRRIANDNAHLLASTVPESRPAFRKIAQYIEDHYSFYTDPDKSHDLRMQARSHAGLNGALSIQPAITSGLRVPTNREERFLDAEIIAIYW